MSRREKAARLISCVAIGFCGTSFILIVSAYCFAAIAGLSLLPKYDGIAHTEWRGCPKTLGALQHALTLSGLAVLVSLAALPLKYSIFALIVMLVAIGALVLAVVMHGMYID